MKAFNNNRSEAVGMTVGPQRIVIVGGGTAGWMSAAALAHLLPSSVSLQLVESEQIGTVGVGEATIPHIRYFNSLLGIDEREFIRATQATYKLAIEFVGWGRETSRYLHPFSAFGGDIDGIDFHHYWLHTRDEWPELSLDAFSLAAQAARLGRFAPPPEEAEFGYGYAFHLDASRYARFLRNYAEQRGVTRTEGRIQTVIPREPDGGIAAVQLTSGERIEGDLFIDCSGFRALLLGQALGVPFNSWKHWLPCDRAVAIACGALAEPPSFTRSTATATGWQWRIPLQERTGNGQVYDSRHISDDEACAQLMASLVGEPNGEPNLIRFEAGARARSWEKNVVAIGLSSGFLEPLESTSIYLIQMAIFKLVEFFPRGENEAVGREAFNRWMSLEYERVRDFIILHYHLNQREDSSFWQDCAHMSVPDSLKRKIALFRESAAIEFYDQGLFALPSWLAVYLGQGLSPQAIDPRVAQQPVESLKQPLEQLANHLNRYAQAMPRHREVLARGGVAPNTTAPMSLYGGRYG
ncbi:tryptophan 7-halogenase [Marinimicrobium sp. C6131]|uniref:tryptophan halogenase family protein n=1 Tax=Marinimicrobium sp. C6131 TaxID=3022676 RepID=UPI00223D487C|nr:tryptophan halogenase family protein [Marinimicrobium sp. C6131]UZJ44478.1 tryptophan 7-halogenase [Marinimicrobium sp. C6131]